MWQQKTFKNRDAMSCWLKKNSGKIQWVEVFVNNSFCVEWRKLIKVY